MATTCSPREVEEALCEHHAVAGAAVIGIKNVELGEKIGAAVALKPGNELDPDELPLRRLQVPAQRVSTHSPRGPTGKISRREIATCRQTGRATVRGEVTVDVDSVAARIMDERGQVVAALSVVVRAGSVKHHAALPSVVTSGLAISRPRLAARISR